MEQLLARGPDLDAVFCASDLMAAGALGVILASGRHVPDDVAVVGYDDSPVATTTRAAAQQHPTTRRGDGPRDGRPPGRDPRPRRSGPPPGDPRHGTHPTRLERWEVACPEPVGDRRARSDADRRPTHPGPDHERQEITGRSRNQEESIAMHKSRSGPRALTAAHRHRRDLGGSVRQHDHIHGAVRGTGRDRDGSPGERQRRPPSSPRNRCRRTPPAPTAASSSDGSSVSAPADSRRRSPSSRRSSRPSTTRRRRSTSPSRSSTTPRPARSCARRSPRGTRRTSSVRSASRASTCSWTSCSTSGRSSSRPAST